MTDWLSGRDIRTMMTLIPPMPKRWAIGDYGPLLVDGQRKDGVVGGAFHADLTEVDGIVPALAEAARNRNA